MNPRWGASPQLERLLETVLDVTQGLDTLGALQRCLDAAVELTSARYGALGVLGPDGEHTNFLYVGVDDQTRGLIGALPAGRGVLGMLDEQQTSIRIDRLAEHAASVGLGGHHPPMTSFLGASILVRGQMYGRLYLTDKLGQTGNPEPFTGVDEDIVQALAAAAGVAVENGRQFERTRQQERWERSVTAIDSAALAGSSPGEVLQMVAREARRLSDADVAVVALPSTRRGLVTEVVEVRDPDFDPPARDARWSVERSRRGLPATGADLDAARRWLGGTVPEASVLRAAHESGQTRVASSPDPNEAGTAFGTTVAIPMRAGDRGLGVLVVAWDQATTHFGPELLEVAETFARQAAVTLVLAESRSEQERLLVYRDRDRIARDLHDLVVQRVFATGVGLQAAIKRFDVQGDLAERLEQAVEQLNETIREIRQTIFELHEPPGSGPAVTARIMAEVARAAPVLGFEPTASYQGPVDSISDNRVVDRLLAAVREGLSNVARHAGASRVEVQVSVGNGWVRLVVSDNGVGVPEQVLRASGTQNLADRAGEYGGSSELRNNPDGPGARLEWSVPLG